MRTFNLVIKMFLRKKVRKMIQELDSLIKENQEWDKQDDEVMINMNNILIEQILYKLLN